MRWPVSPRCSYFQKSVKMEKIIEWLKANKFIVIGAAAMLFLAPKLLRKPRRRRRTKSYTVPVRRRSRMTVRRINKPARRSSGGRKARKAWQVKGSLAARRHMARLRKMRG